MGATLKEKKKGGGNTYRKEFAWIRAVPPHTHTHTQRWEANIGTCMKMERSLPFLSIILSDQKKVTKSDRKELPNPAN